MTNQTSYRLHRRTLLTGVAVLGASATTACATRQSGQQTPTAAVVEQNTTNRRGVGLRAFNPGALRYSAEEIARAKATANT